MTVISLTNYSGSQISRIARNITVATAGYGVDDRKSFSTFNVDDATGTITFVGPDGTSRTLTI